MSEQKYEILDIGLLVGNTWNPNEVKETNMEALKNEMAKTGSNVDQPVIVRKHPTEDGKYEIVDGYHRYSTLKELGIFEIHAIVKDYDDKEAKLKTISMNKLRGDFDSVRLAELIVDLKTNHNVTDEEIQKNIRIYSRRNT